MDSDDNDPNFANPNGFCRNDRVAAIRAETGMVPEVPQKRSPGGRKRCDTWHGKSPRSPDSTHVLEPSIAEGLNTKRKFARKNPWGYCSYADLITMALERAPSRKLTLAEVYDWIVANIPYFYDKGDANSSIGWKNSIRHNLSLHEKFCRVPHDGSSSNTKNIGAYWTLVDESQLKNCEKKMSMSPPPLGQSERSPPPPSNFRKRASTMPSNMGYNRKTSRIAREKRYLSNHGHDDKSIEVDSGIDRLSRQSSLSSLNVTEDMSRINLDSSPMVKSEYRSHSQSNMDRISRHNRFAKINPDNSVLVEVLLTAEQYELVQSGKYIVSLVDANDHMSTNSSLKLPNWRTNQKTNNNDIEASPDMLKGTSVEPQNSAIPIERGSRLPFSPHSDFSESSGVCNSYSPKNSPPRSQYIQNRHPKQETEVKFEQPTDNNFINFITGESLFEQIGLTDVDQMDFSEILDHGSSN